MFPGIMVLNLLTFKKHLQKMESKTTFLILITVFIACSAYSQSDIKVTGSVKNPDNTTVRGVSIFVDDVNTGKQTNSKGTYKVTIPGNAKKISVLSKSGQVAEMDIDGKTEINFILPAAEEENKSVNENRKEVKRADTSLDNTTYSDVYEMIRRMPGVVVRGRKVEIIGMTTTMSPAGTDPLFVVDGRQVNSIDHIVPSSVKSIEILKGTAATIYGVRGANGVVSITLK